jgi:hypothetical protein
MPSVSEARPYEMVKIKCYQRAPPRLIPLIPPVWRESRLGDDSDATFM